MKLIRFFVRFALFNCSWNGLVSFLAHTTSTSSPTSRLAHANVLPAHDLPAHRSITSFTAALNPSNPLIRLTRLGVSFTRRWIHRESNLVDVFTLFVYPAKRLPCSKCSSCSKRLSCSKCSPCSKRSPSAVRVSEANSDNEHAIGRTIPYRLTIVRDTSAEIFHSSQKSLLALPCWESLPYFQLQTFQGKLGSLRLTLLITSTCLLLFNLFTFLKCYEHYEHFSKWATSFSYLWPSPNSLVLSVSLM